MADDPNEPGKTPEPAPTDDGGKKFDEKYVKELRDEAKQTRLELKAQKDAHGKLADTIKEMKTSHDEQQALLKKLAGVADDDAPVDAVAVLTTEVKGLRADVTKSRDEAKAATEKAQQMAVATEIQKAALETGLSEGVNAADILPFIDQKAVTYNSETESVEGAKEAVAALAKAKPYFFNEENAQPAIGTPGGGTLPSRPGGGDKSFAEDMEQLGKKMAESRGFGMAGGVGPAPPPNMGPAQR